MKNTVIYARYSSTGQNEQTIEGQIRICKEFAEQRGLNVIGTYFDKAKTGTNDKRPDFQRMIGASVNGAFQYVIVYMFDRFARNRIDSIMYKNQLKSCGVKVLSALEPVSDDEGGEFYEMYLEWNAEKYSKRLSIRIRDGLTTAIDNGTFIGAKLLFGYGLVNTEKVGKKGAIKRVIVNDDEAEIVRYIFSEYASGVPKLKIADALNTQGYRIKGKPFRGREFEKWLTNEKYTGTFSIGGRECKNMYPQIIERDLFNKVQERLKEKRYFAGANSAKELYLLQGKVYCGHCGTSMVADGGTSRNGKQHYYYACKKKKKSLCDKKRESKDGLELAVTQFAHNFLSDPKNVSRGADDVLAYHEQMTAGDGLRSVEVRIANAQKEADGFVTAFVEAQNPLLRLGIEKKMADLEILLDDLHAQKAKIELARGVKISKQDILLFVAQLLKGDMHDKEYQKKLIDNFISSVYIYDNEIVAYLNLDASKDAKRISLADTNTAKDTLLGVQTLTPLLHQVPTCGRQ